MGDHTAPRRGTTLIEMLVTVVLIGILASVATPALRRVAMPPVSDAFTAIAESLDVAIASGRTITLPLSVESRPAFATVGPDGSVVADSALHIDRLTGRRNDAP
jgi:prepilin-type N-terminal cleavage/methylation domain-containing protein